MHSKSFPQSHQRLALFKLIIVVFLFKLAFLVDGQPRFTQEPPSNLYVVSGENATFNWKYFVVDRKKAFEPLSPKWSFYDGTEHVIGNDFRTDSWNWKTDLLNCPQRLLKPTLRVFRKENATLVITNVTTADNGMYRCTLVLDPPPPLKSKLVQLIVTVNPQIKITGKTDIIENATLTLNCSAVGPPTPNITWINNASVVLEQGIQSAVLTITNITRKQAGRYKCNATNNPNEDVDPVQKKINVTVKYPVEFDGEHSTKSVEAYLGQRNVELKSVADGVPVPTHVWFLPNMTIMDKSENSTESIYTIEVVKEEHIGNWIVNITNGIGSYYYLHRIKVIKGADGNGGTPGGQGECTDAVIAGFVIGLIIAIVIIVVLVVLIVIRKKEKKEWATWEKVLVVIGVIVAIIIIIVVIVFIDKKCV